MAKKHCILSMSRNYQGNLYEACQVVVADDLLITRGGSKGRGELCVWHFGGRFFGNCEIHSDELATMAVSKSGRILVTGGFDKRGGAVRHIDDLSCVTVRLDSFGEYISQVAISNDCMAAAMAMWNQSAAEYSLADGCIIARYSVPERTVTAIAYSSCSKYLLTASGSMPCKIRKWCRDNGKLLSEVDGHSRRIDDLKPSADGKLLVSIAPAEGKKAGEVKIWDAATLQLLHCLIAHRPEAQSVAVSSDGKLCVTGGADKYAIVWDLARKREICRTPRLERQPMGVQFSMDGTEIVTASGSLTAWCLRSCL